MASLAKSLALASLLASPTSRAFTATIPSASTTPRPVRPPFASTSSLRYEPEGDGEGQASSPPSFPRRDEPLSSNSNAIGEDGLGADLRLPAALPPPDPVPTGPRASEFHDLAPRPVGDARRARLEAEARTAAVYVPGGSDAWWDLQDEIRGLEESLAAARSDAEGGDSGADAAVDLDALVLRLRRARARDPAHVYRVVGGAGRSAAAAGQRAQGARFREESLRARRMLPQYNLEGLWVGRYGAGFEMINVTYSGDTLIAYKVTGDNNIPRGEVSFTANLSPHRDPRDALDPIVLSDGAAEKWGVRRLSRFPGRGHAAEPGFRNPHALAGQLVVIGAEGAYFSFAWVPLEHQIFFGRPSPELALRMLREGGAPGLTAGAGREAPGLDSGQRALAEHAARCLEATADAIFDEASEGKTDPFSCIWHGDNAEYCFFE